MIARCHILSTLCSLAFVAPLSRRYIRARWWRHPIRRQRGQVVSLSESSSLTWATSLSGRQWYARRPAVAKEMKGRAF